MGVSSTTRMVEAPGPLVAGGDVIGLCSRGDPLDCFEVELIREPGNVVSEPDLLEASLNQFLGDRVQIGDAADRGRLAKPLRDSAERGRAAKVAHLFRRSVNWAGHSFEARP